MNKIHLLLTLITIIFLVVVVGSVQGWMREEQAKHEIEVLSLQQQLQEAQQDTNDLLEDVHLLLRMKGVLCDTDPRACLTQEVHRFTEISGVAYVNYPTPVISWREQGAVDYYIKDYPLADLSIVGVSVGEMPMSKNEKNLLGGGLYNEGDMAFAVAFDIQPRVLKRGSIYLHMKRILDDGGRIESNTRQFRFPDTGGLQADQEMTYPPQKIIFVVPADKREFLFTTGGMPNTTFRVKRVNGTIELETVSVDYGSEVQY